MVGKHRGHIGQRQDPVDVSGGDGSAGHAIIFRLIGILRHDTAAGLAQCGQAQTAVGARARQDHAQRLRPVAIGQRMQQGVERQPRAARGLRGRKVQGARPDREVAPRRDDIDMPGGKRTPVLRLEHDHLCMFGEKFGQQAVVRGIEMLDQDERGIGQRCATGSVGRSIGGGDSAGNGVEQPRHRLQAAGRGADGDNR